MPGFFVGGLGQGAAGRPQVYYQYSWYINNLFGTNIGQDGGDALIYLKEATYPTFTVDSEKHQGSSLIYKFAKSVTWDDVKVTWYDTQGLLDTIIQWRKKVWQPETGLQPANQYKTQSEMNYMLPEGGGDRSFSLINSWPSAIKHGDLTYTQSEIKVIDVTITYDWCEES